MSYLDQCKVIVASIIDSKIKDDIDKTKLLEKVDKASTVKELPIDYDSVIGLDSFDRLFALFLVEYHPEAIFRVSGNEEEFKKVYETLDHAIRTFFERDITSASYDNYEREGISNVVAYGNICYIASQGKDVVLNDSYQNGGWFGAS